jgi:hypothetical protein
MFLKILKALDKLVDERMLEFLELLRRSLKNDFPLAEGEDTV